MNTVVINPFQPGNPVPPGVFAGRLQQLNEISTCIYQTATFNPQNILITGERGIGKTSIAMVTKAIAEKQIIWKEGFLENPFLVVNVIVQEGTPSEIVIAQIIKELDLAIKPSFTNVKNVLKEVIDTFSELKLFGSGYTTKDKSNNPRKVYLEAEKCIRKIAKALKENKKDQGAFCIIIDELDKMGDFDNFSSFWKVVQENLAYDNCRNLMLVLVGMPDIMEQLSQSHESFLRMFVPITLDRMPDNEAKMIIQKALENGKPKKSISQKAIKEILFYSENYPHLIQELGYSSFKMSAKDIIEKEDVKAGLHGNELYEGSVKKLGRLFFSKMYSTIRKNQNYKEVLKIIANLSGNENNWVSRKKIMEQSSKKSTSLGVAISDLTNKKLIIKNPDKTGEYKIHSKMFQVYISKILTV